MKKVALFLGLMAAAFVVSGGIFLLWALWIPSPMPEALEAMTSSETVEVRTEPTLTFLPKGKKPKTGIVIYPGARVDARAYAPLGRRLAEAGYLAAIPSVRLNMAVFEPDAAERVIAENPEIETWVAAGHSLGGTMAARYAETDPGRFRGVIFLGSYPLAASQLKSSGLAVLSIYGTLDGVSEPRDIRAAERVLPANTVWVAIEGGNHAQFGYYGDQSGDNAAAISREEQQRQTAEAIINFLRSLEVAQI